MEPYKFPRLVPHLVHLDSRGHLKKFPPAPKMWGGAKSAVKDSYVSYSEAGAFRGLHCQIGDAEQAKSFMLLGGRTDIFAVNVERLNLEELEVARFMLREGSGSVVVVPRGWATAIFAVGSSTIWTVSDHSYEPDAEMVVDASYLRPFIELASNSLSPKDRWRFGTHSKWMASQVS